MLIYFLLLPALLFKAPAQTCIETAGSSPKFTFL
jgi:hypothetical protein